MPKKKPGRPSYESLGGAFPGKLSEKVRKLRSTSMGYNSELPLCPSPLPHGVRVIDRGNAAVGLCSEGIYLGLFRLPGRMSK